MATASPHRLARIALPLALLVAFAPASARAHDGPLVFGVLIGLLPAAGAEVQFREEHEQAGGFLLSWPLQIPLDLSDSAGGSKNDPYDVWSTHRLVVSPELRFGGSTEFGGRLGYRYVARKVFTGLGASYTDSLGMSVSPELGVRWFDKEGRAGWFLAARADVPVTSHVGERLAASVSVGFLVY